MPLGRVLETVLKFCLGEHFDLESLFLKFARQAEKEANLNAKTPIVEHQLLATISHLLRYLHYALVVEVSFECGKRHCVPILENVGLIIRAR